MKRMEGLDIVAGVKGLFSLLTKQTLTIGERGSALTAWINICVCSYPVSYSLDQWRESAVSVVFRTHFTTLEGGFS
jgi:hypothetical protein